MRRHPASHPDEMPVEIAVEPHFGFASGGLRPYKANLIYGKQSQYFRIVQDL